MSDNEETRIIIQARIGSTRLPKKMVRPFYNGECIFSLLIERILESFNNEQIILATSIDNGNDILADISKSHGIHCFRGDENDVLRRFIQAAQTFKASKIIRVCADNPFLDMPSLLNLYDKFNKSDFDYMAYATSDKVPTIKTHYGFWAEAVNLATLMKISSLTDEKLYHEHVTNYIYTHPDLFNINYITIPYDIETHDRLRLTIDTQEDFDIQKSIFENVFSSNPHFTAKEVCNYVDKNPFYYSAMANEIVKNKK